MDVKTLGQKVKAKYPQYQNMSDEDIGTKMMAKYPQYGDVKQDQKGKWIPVAGGIVGGLVGSLLGPAGAAAGAAVGTGAGYAIKDTVNPKSAEMYTGKTKMGFKELSPEGRKQSLMDVANATKDAAIAGGAAYVGVKIPGMGPAGKGVLPALGRIGTKTAVGAASGAGAGFAAGDLQSTSLQDRKSNAGTGAIVGGGISLLGSTGQEAFNKVKSDRILKEMFSKKTLNYPKTGADIATTGAKETTRTFNRTQFYKDWFNQIQKSSDVNKQKMATQIEKTLSSELGIPIKGVGSASTDDFAKLMSQVEKLETFKKEIPMLDALIKRRDNVSTLSKNLFGGVKQTTANTAKLTQNTAYNEQLKKILDIKDGDKAVQTYYNTISLLKKLGLVSGIVTSLGAGGNLIRNIAGLGEVAGK